MNRTGLILLIVLVLGAVGYFAYDYVKEKPPSFLTELVTKTAPPPPLPEGDSAPLTVPEGFAATIFARNVPGARVMTWDPKGAMLVSLTKDGKVVALPDVDGDQKADEVVTVLSGLNQPHGILVKCGDMGQEPCTLYIAETGALKSYQYDADTKQATYIETLATFPTGGGHYTRTLLEHPDGRHLLISVGSSCNVCNEESPQRATVQKLSLETNEMTTFASGLRNTVFMEIHPVTGDVWGTDNGRDLVGDDIPPDEINIIREGNDYGWPVCYGKNVYDTDFNGGDGTCAGKTPSRIDLQAHSAALGIAFVPEEGWPEDMWHDAIVAFHGSWNRSTPTGYKVVRIDTETGAQTDFVTGFLASSASEDDAIGRPVDVLIQPGGTMYISDDRAGAIFRIARTQ